MMSHSTEAATGSSSPPELTIAPRQSKVEESDVVDEDDDDDDMFMVPEMEEAEAAEDASATTRNNSSNASGVMAKRGRSKNPADREHKKIKRLLRNRVSAQQARERKKVYVNDMELRARELQESNARLEEKISTLINENTMLRKVLISSRPKNEGSSDS